MMQGDVAGNREIQALYEQISKLQMKVALSLEEAGRKQRKERFLPFFFACRLTWIVANLAFFWDDRIFL